MTHLTTHTDTWSELDERAVATIRALVADIVENARGGHPGTAISMAPAAHLLFSRVLRHDPSDPTWLGRDRFVLSMGHSSLTLYIQLFLTGYPYTLDDLKATRTLHSKTPGHPELDPANGIEMTTGPLGEGVASAVGMAMAARRERGLLDPDAAEGTSPFDHTIWAFAGDGCIQEGVAIEAASLAGHQQLGNLVLLWDDNRISADDDTRIANSEDTLAKFAAMGWHTQHVEWRQGEPDGERYREDPEALRGAFEAARAETGRPSIIQLSTIMGWPAPTKQNTGAIHGALMGEAEVAGMKRAVGFDPERTFVLDEDVLEHTRSVMLRARAQRDAWDASLNDWRSREPQRATLLDRLTERGLPAGWDGLFPNFETSDSISTRKASGATLNALGKAMPELWGGAADLDESTHSTIEGASVFVPEEYATKQYPNVSRYGRTIHYGIREHGMAAMTSGIALHGLTRPYAATFLQFSFHMLPSVRLAAIMRIPTTYIWTHDSIAMGEDGATHQPIEQMAVLRAMPGLDVVRPADAVETAWAWRTILERASGPAGLVLSRQNLPVLERPAGEEKRGELTARGAYVLLEAAGGDAEVILIATGSEVQLAVQAHAALAEAGVGARVVSMPCREWFAEQSEEYLESVLPRAVRARVSVEAATQLGWRDFVGDLGETVAIDRFGESAPGEELLEYFGFTAEAVVQAAYRTLDRVKSLK
ncbi:MAG: transketolase [Leucobacter sp.]